MEGRSSAVFTSVCNTSDLAVGNRTITAYVDVLTGENDTGDNARSGWLIVAGPYDITGPDGCPDGKIDLRDVGYVARRFGTTASCPLWDPAADITGPTYLVPDGKVDMRDIGLIARHFGESYS